MSAGASRGALERLLPTPLLLERDEVDLALPVEQAWQLVRHEDLGRSPLVHALFALRTVPDRLAGEHPGPPSLRLDDLVSTVERPGFQILVDDPPREVVVGAIGQVWRPSIPFVHVSTPADFFSFAEPGQVKVAWSLALSPLSAERSRLACELRVDTTDERSARNFKAYFAFVGPFSRFIRRSLLASLEREHGGASSGNHPRAARPAPRRDELGDVLEGVGGAAIMVAALLTPFTRDARSHWGLDQELAERVYPGDELIAEPRWGWTHAVEIDAPAAEVWPWVAQIGADRGGFYSYQWLENIAGCELENAEQIHAEWAARQGDSLRLHPDMPALKVASVEPGQHLLAHGPADPAARSSGKPWAEVTWLFYVEPLGDRRCRLVSRYRCACSDDLKTRLSLGSTFVEPVGFAMDRKMLLGVKERAERAAR